MAEGDLSRSLAAYRLATWRMGAVLLALVALLTWIGVVVPVPAAGFGAFVLLFGGGLWFVTRMLRARWARFRNLSIGDPRNLR